MSVELKCDWCGVEIETDSLGGREPLVHVDVEPSRGADQKLHYHSECWEEVWDVVQFSRRAQQGLDLLPVCAEPGAAERSIYEMEVDSQAISALRRAGIETLGQLAERTEDELLELKGISWRRLEAIEEALGGCGLSLRAPGVLVGQTGLMA